MACFIVPGAEAAVAHIVKKNAEKKEAIEENKKEITIPLSRKIGWLRDMLVGGCTLLLFEHIWHGEIVPYFPFLTAMSNPEDMMEMFKEMATVGVGMTVVLTVVWLFVCKAADAIVRRDAKEENA
ncbi:MAG: hypothetical protein K6G40_05965 [Eubacterium sp.]|nr:hypothetical protein [Eubacterium sp.]